MRSGELDCQVIAESSVEWGEVGREVTNENGEKGGQFPIIMITWDLSILQCTKKM